MGLTNVQVFDRIEGKIEAVRGTAETTMTRPIVFPYGQGRWTWEADDSVVAETLRSYHARHADSSIVGVAVARINLEMIMTYEEIIWWNCLILGGGSARRTGTTTGSTPAGYTYPFTPSGGTDDLDSATFKLGDGAAAYKFDRGLVNTATYRWDPARGGGTFWMLAVEIWARLIGTTTFDSPSAIARRKIKAAGTKVYIDEPGGTIGATQVLNAIRSGSITVNNQLEEKVFSEYEDKTADDVGRGSQLITYDLQREHNSDTEAAKLRAGTLRKIRILKEGDTIGASPATKYKWQVDLPVAQYKPTMGPDWRGQNRVLGYQGEALRDDTTTVPITATSVIASSSVAA